MSQYYRLRLISRLVGEFRRALSLGDALVEMRARFQFNSPKNRPRSRFSTFTMPPPAWRAELRYSIDCWRLPADAGILYRRGALPPALTAPPQFHRFCHGSSAPHLHGSVAADFVFGSAGADTRAVPVCRCLWARRPIQQAIKFATSVTIFRRSRSVSSRPFT